MTTRTAFEERLADWLEEGPTAASDEILASVLAAFPAIPQRRAVARIPRMTRPAHASPRLLAGVAALVAIVVGLAYLVPIVSPAIVGGPPSPLRSVAASASPSTSPSTSPSPTISGNGLPSHDRIAFGMSFGKTGNNSNILTIEPDGTGLRMLTDVVSGCEQDPAWTPSGDRVVFDESLPNGSSCVNATASHLVAMSPDGGSIDELAPPPAHVFDGDPVVSPDGSRIAFDRFDPTGRLTGIWIMGADGTHVTRVTTAARSATGGDRSPDFSPDGSMLVFERDPTDQGGGAIQVVGIDGHGQRQVTPASSHAQRPRWSPDGSQIVFGTGDLPGSEIGRNIRVVNVDGSGSVALTHEIGPDTAGDPAWSPDGTMIVFSQFHGGDAFVALVAIRSDGSHPVLIWHPTPATDNFPQAARWGMAP